MRAEPQTRTKVLTPSVTPVSRSLLQRTCACGGTPGVDGECAECRKNRMVPQCISKEPSFLPIGIQTKLMLNTPGDFYEQEANRVAEQVIRMPEPQQSNHEDWQTQHVHVSDSEGMVAPPIVHEVLRSSGQPLDAAMRGFLEPRFGHDFGQVMIHCDAHAAEAAAAINARAFTVNRDIVFGAGEYAPQTESGRRLLSHEAAHVVQQRASTHLRDGVVQRKATGSIESRSVQSEQAGPASSNVKTKKGDPLTLPEVAITAEGPKSADKIIDMIRILQGRLLTVKTKQQAIPIVEAIKALVIALESAPISPVPKRDFVAGPIKFVEFGPYFYDFGFESLQDKHWREGWSAIYKLAAGPFGTVIDLIDLFLGPEEERVDVATDILVDQAVDQVAEKGKDVGVYMLRKGMPKGLAKGGAVSIKSLGKAVSLATTAYDLYKANTEGPSPHAAAVETAAMIMAMVYGVSDGRDGKTRRGGFIPTPTTSYCRVARQQEDPFPQLKDRKLAFDLMGNRIYERMRNLIAPKHIATAESFYAFRKTKLDNAWNIVEAAGGDLVGRKIKLIQGTEKQIEEMEEWAKWKETNKTELDVSKPLKFPLRVMPSDQYGGIANTIKQRYGPVPKNFTVAPCNSPQALSLDTKDCGTGTDFTYYDFPFSTLSLFDKLMITPFRAMSNVALLAYMLIDLAMFAGDSGVEMVAHFASGKGTAMLHPTGSLLSNLAASSGSFKNALASVQGLLHTQLLAQASKGVIDCSVLKAPIPRMGFSFLDSPTLKAIIGGTHGLSIHIVSFVVSPTTRKYAMNLRFVICDNFGVDADDLYWASLRAFWVLQHERKGFRPFVNNIVVEVPLGGAI